MNSTEDKNENDTLDENENDFDTQELPFSKRPKTTIERVTANATPINAASKSAAASHDVDDSDSDEDNDVPLATLFGKKTGAASHPVVLNDSIDEGIQVPKIDNGAAVTTSAGAPSDPIVLDDSTDQGDEACETNADIDTAAEFPPAALSDNACFICGSNLKNLSTGLKGRLNHLKRCSKKHGVTARDVKLNDDSEIFVPPEHDERATSASANNNDNSWHAGAATDLALANHGCKGGGHKENKANRKQAATKSASKQTTMGNFFQMPVRSLNNALLAGARRMSKSTELLIAKKSSSDNNGPKGGKRKRVDYSQVRFVV